MAVKIVIDSASDISVKEGKQLGIQVIPMVVTFGTHVGPGAVGVAFFSK